MTAEREKTAARVPRVKPGDADASDPAKERRAEFLTARQLAEFLQISESTIHRLRRAGRIPAVMLTSRLIRFNLRDVKVALRQLQAERSQSDGENQPDRGPDPQLTFDDLNNDFNNNDFNP